MPGHDNPVEEMLRSSPALMNAVTDHTESWVLLRSGVLNIHDELDAEDVQRIASHAHLGQIQFARRFKVSATMLRLLDDHVLAYHPQVVLRGTLNGFGAFDDLCLLRHLPRLRALSVDGSHAIDLEPVREFVALESLGVGGLGTSLGPLKDYASLRSFGFNERIKDPETIGTFSNLQRLTIGGGSPGSLTFLEPLAHLTSLAFQLVAAKRFEELCALPALEELSIWRAKKLEMQTLSPLNGIARLKRLTLSDLPRITSLEWLTNPSLRVLELENLKGLRSYASVAGLSNLEILLVKDKVNAGQISELAAAPRLKEMHVYDAYLRQLQPTLDLSSLPFAVKAI